MGSGTLQQTQGLLFTHCLRAAKCDGTQPAVRKCDGIHTQPWSQSVTTQQCNTPQVWESACIVACDAQLRTCSQITIKVTVTVTVTRTRGWLQLTDHTLPSTSQPSRGLLSETCTPRSQASLPRLHSPTNQPTTPSQTPSRTSCTHALALVQRCW